MKWDYFALHILLLFEIFQCLYCKILLDAPSLPEEGGGCHDEEPERLQAEELQDPHPEQRGHAGGGDKPAATLTVMSALYKRYRPGVAEDSHHPVQDAASPPGQLGRGLLAGLAQHQEVRGEGVWLHLL